MKMDKKSLMNYDYKVYKNKYDELKGGIKNQEKVDALGIDDMETWLQAGIFCRRLKFRKTQENFYITTASISRGYGYYHDYKFGKDYIIPYWGDQNQRAKALMKFDIGHESPANGKLDLVGDFTPFENNLLDVKYQTILGKEYIKNAKKFINGDESNDNLEKKIDISNFFRLKFELASQGIQAKALYDTKNLVIDGSAGTGKSTIAIQKLKYFHENNSVSQDKQLIIVGNTQLKVHFLTLLKDKNINLPNIQIKTLLEAFKSIEVDSIEDINKEAKNIERNLNNLIEKRDKKSLHNHYIYLFNFIGLDFFKKKLLELIDDLDNDRNLNEINKLKDDIKSIEFSKENYEKDIKSYINDIEQEKVKLLEKSKDKNIIEENNLEIKLIDEELSKYSNKIKNYANKIKNNKSRIEKLEGKHYKKILNNLDKYNILAFDIIDDLLVKLQNTVNAENIKVLKWLLAYEKFLDDKENKVKRIDELKNLKKQEKDSRKIQEIESLIDNITIELEKKYKNANKSYFDKFNNVMKKVYFSRQYLENTGLINNDLIYKILNIDKKDFDTIIVDEAQDFSKYELELIRLHTKRIILTGDVLQNIHTGRGLSSWNEILNINLFNTNDGKLNKYSLKHNFRQTYQLANASYNYRQLLLNEKIEDIGFDYYENEKIFDGQEYAKPTLSLLETDLKIMEFIEHKFAHIQKFYTERFPIIVVYKDEEEKSFYINIFQDYAVSEDKREIKEDIILLSLNNIKGNEFPVVMANLSSFTEKELYLIMTRAQFELEFFIKRYKKFNPILYQLINNSEHINFIHLKNIEINNIEINEVRNVNAINNNENFKNRNERKNTFNNKEHNDKLFNLEEKNNILTIDKNILKHKAEVMQWDEELNLDIITDEEKYKNNFIKKIRENTEKSKKN